MAYSRRLIVVSEKGKLFGMGDNTDNQLGISQRGKSEDPVLRLNAPTRIHLSAHSRAAKPVQVSCGASHTAVVTGQSYAAPSGSVKNILHLNVRGWVALWLVRSTPERAVRVRALAGDSVLCCWARHLTKLPGSDLRWTSIPSRGNRDKLRKL